MDTYGILSLLPPLVAIVLCIATKQLMISLALGAFSGALVLMSFNPITAYIDFMYKIFETVADSWNASILVFTMLLGGFIGLLSKSGGTQALVAKIIQKVNTGRKGQLITALLSILLFFDDYTSICLTGVVMRPLTDRLRISREKLSYIVDSAGCGVSAISPVSNWTAFEIGVIGEVLVAMGLTSNAYVTFLSSIPYRFYCIASVVFVFFIAIQRRDYGKMYQAEIRAMTTGDVVRPGSSPMINESDESLKLKEGTPLRVSNFVIPFVILFGVIIVGVYFSGGGMKVIREDGLAGLMGNVDILATMAIAVLTATIVLGIMMVAQKIMSVTETVDTWTNGMKSILFTIVFIVLAWAVSGYCKELGTANYVVELMVAASFPSWLLPTAVFLISGLIAFSTGSSWGTMSLVLPLALPASLAINAPMAATLGAVLTGATMGDHISPISESVVMSSMSSACDHIDHVFSQMPYALTCAAISIICGFIPAGFGVPAWICLLIVFAAEWLVIRFVGKPTDEKTLGVDLSSAETSAK